jgi:hypothetical protein
MAESGGSRIPRRRQNERDREEADQENGDQRVGERERDEYGRQSVSYGVKVLVMGPLRFWRETEERGEELGFAWGQVVVVK